MPVEDAEANGIPMEESKSLSNEKPPQVKIASPSEPKEKKKEFEGLTKEELMKYADDPKWVKIRWALFAVFWLVWLAMLVASILIIIYAPKCPSPEPKSWWQKSPAYKVDIANFKDSNGDGTGDLRGLTEEAPSIAELDVPSVRFSPFFSGTITDSARVTDFKGVDASLGDLNDWTAMIEKMHEHGIEVIIDIILDETSTEHMWFKESVARNPEYENFYQWQDQPEDGFTNNQERGQAYKVGKSGLPQLNLTNPKVVSELKSALSFWMDHGVAGFNLLHLDTYLPTQDETVALLQQLRSVHSSDNKEDGCILISVNDDMANSTAFYGNEVNTEHVGDLLHLVSSGHLLDNVKADSGVIDAASVIKYVNTILDSPPKNAWPAFSLSRMDSRIAASHPELVDPLNMLAAVLPATSFINAGDELGQAEGHINRDMAANQTKATKEDRYTHRGVFQQLSQIRTQDTILYGSLDIRMIDGCMLVSRVKKGNPGYLLIINFTDNTVTVDASSVPDIAPKVRLQVESTGGKDFSKMSKDVKSIPKEALVIEAKQAIIFTFVPSYSD